MDFIEVMDTARPVPAFNVVDLAMARGAARAAAASGRPAILQLSARVVEYYGAETVVAVVRAAAAAFDASVFIHLDHCSDGDTIAAAIAAGFDGVMADGSHMEAEVNAEFTRKWAVRARESGVLVEGALGFGADEEDGVLIGRDAGRTSVEQLRSFAEFTGVNLLGTDIGTRHGLYETAPVIDLALVAEFVRAVPAGFVVHGGSGLDRTVLGDLARHGAAKVNFSTDLKYAWAAAARRAVGESTAPDPLRAVREIERAISEVCSEKIRALSTGGSPAHSVA